MQAKPPVFSTCPKAAAVPADTTHTPLALAPAAVMAESFTRAKPSVQ